MPYLSATTIREGSPLTAMAPALAPAHRLGSVASSPSLLWHQHEDHAIFSSARLAAGQGSGAAPMFGTATFLNPPRGAQAFGTGGALWAWAGGSSGNATVDVGRTFSLASARHLDSRLDHAPPTTSTTSTSKGRQVVDLVLAESNAVAGTCMLRGFRSSGNATAEWTVTVPRCAAELTTVGQDGLALSQDGSTAVLAHATLGGGGGGGGGGGAACALSAFDAQSGAALWTYDCGGAAAQRMHADVSRDGSHALLTNGAALHVVERATGQLRPTKDGSLPLDMGAAVSAQICPMGVFLTFGFADARVFKWSSLGGAYRPQRTFPPPDGGGGWRLTHSATSVNGGGLAPGGCLCGFGWVRDMPGASSSSSSAGAVAASAFSMLSFDQYLGWIGPPGPLDSSPKVAMHMQYLALAHWGSDAAPAPRGDGGGATDDAAQLQLFTLAKSPVPTSRPLFSYNTPGSMFDVDVAAGSNGTSPVVYVVAGGKAVHATVQGQGGDAFAFEVGVPSTRDHHVSAS